MRLKALKVGGVRNLANTVLEPGERFNVFSGDNGQGKTNLVEAIYIAGTLRSFRTSRLAEVISVDQPEAHIGARVVREGIERVYEVAIGQRSKRVRLDGKAVRPLGRYFGEFNVVLFAPEDLAVPKGSPGDRRRFLDRAVFNRQSSHLVTTQDYERVLRTRNTVLRDLAAGKTIRGEDLLAVYDEQLSRLGAQLIANRRALLTEMAPRYESAFSAISRAGLAVALHYTTAEAPELATAPVESLAELLAARLAESRRQDRARQTTSVGPHRHDLGFVLEGHPAAAFASQGQLRAMILAWKTAEMDLLADAHGDHPILLLDDVSSELDRSRNEYLFEFLRLRTNQCFITTTHADHVLLDKDRNDFKVIGGQIQALERT